MKINPEMFHKFLKESQLPLLIQKKKSVRTHKENYPDKIGKFDEEKERLL